MEPYPAPAVANFFIKKGLSENDNLTLMKLNKLIYIAHGMTLAAYDKPLINEVIQAWKFGPVVKSIYHLLKYYGMSKIDSEISNIDLDEDGNLVKNNYSINPKDKDITNLLDFVWGKYRKYDGYQLSNWTHLPESPWHKTWFGDGGYKEREKPIPDNLIREYFLSMDKK